MKHLILNIIFISTGLIGLVQCHISNDIKPPQIPIDQLQPGDIAFRRGEGVTSSIVLHNDADGKYSHVGIVVKYNGQSMIVHSVPNDDPKQKDIIQLENIESFFSPKSARNGEIKRMELDSIQKVQLNNYALEKVTQKIPFDHDYNLSDTTELYCTELVQLLYQRIGINISEGRITSINVPGMSGNYIMPADIYHNSKLKKIFIY